MQRPKNRGITQTDLLHWLCIINKMGWFKNYKYMLENLSEINTNTAEGRALMGAISILSLDAKPTKTQEQALAECCELGKEIFRDAGPLPQSKAFDRPTFEKALESLINSYSLESGSNTPDYILVEFLKNCLNNFHEAKRLRDNWYGGKRSIINDQAEKWETENTKLLQA